MISLSLLLKIYFLIFDLKNTFIKVFIKFILRKKLSFLIKNLEHILTEFYEPFQLFRTFYNLHLFKI